MTQKQQTFFTATAAFAALVATAFPAHADVVLTYTRESTGSLRPARPQRPGADGVETPPQAPPADNGTKENVTVYIKDTSARVEFRPFSAKPDSEPKRVLIYDSISQKVATLDLVAKTYFTQSYKEVFDGERPQSQQGGPGGGFMGRMTMNGTVDVRAAREHNGFVEKDIAGVKSRQYLVGGSVEMQFNRPQADTAGGQQGGQQSDPSVIAGGVYVAPAAPAGNGQAGGNGEAGGNGQAGGRFGGGRRGGGGFPGGGFPGGPGGGGFTPPSISVQGEVWSTDGLAIYTAGRDTPVAALYRLMLPDNAGPFGGALIKPFIAKLKSMKSLPGESTVGFQMQMNFGNAGGGGNPGGGLATHLAIQSVKTDATLDKAIFTIPTDFKLTEMPAPNFGGRGGPGQGGRFRGNRGNE